MDKLKIGLELLIKYMKKKYSQKSQTYNNDFFDLSCLIAWHIKKKLKINNKLFFMEKMNNQLCSVDFLSASSSANAATSSEPPATHQLLIIFNGFGEHMNIMKIKTPCSAINMSKNANGDIVVVSFVEAASFI